MSLGEDQLLLTSGDGYVSYSTDGNSSWTKISKQVGNDANATVAAASGLASGDWIFAATRTTDEDIYRWQLGTSTGWETLYSEFGDALPYSLVYKNGVLYMVGQGSTKLFRTLSPGVSIPANGYFSTKSVDTISINSTPQAVAVAEGSVVLYGIDNNSDKLYSYTDTLTSEVPLLISPEDGYVPTVNEVSGAIVHFTLSWERPSSKVTQYDLQLKDADGATITTYDEFNSESTVTSDSSLWSIPLAPGKTYKWRVRAQLPVFSGWSEMRTFTVPEADAAIPNVTVEAPPAPIVTVEPPVVTVQPAPPVPAPQVTVNVPPAPAPAPAIPSAILWIIVVIGAVLVIFLIVLIMRTRRTT